MIVLLTQEQESRIKKIVYREIPISTKRPCARTLQRIYELREKEKERIHLIMIGLSVEQINVKLYELERAQEVPTGK